MKTNVKRHAYNRLTVNIPNHELVLLINEAIRAHEGEHYIFLQRENITFLKDAAGFMTAEVTWEADLKEMGG